MPFLITLDVNYKQKKSVDFFSICLILLKCF